MSESGPRITVIGSINMDPVVRCGTLPTPGQTMIAESSMEISGGKGANQAVAAARAGGPVTMIGRVGDDAFADRLVANLEQARIQTEHVLRTDIGKRIESFGEPLAGISLSPAFLLACVTVIAGQFLLTRTVFGRYCIAIGTNAEAVRMSGIRAAPYSIGVFVISGLMCGLAGLAQTSRLSTADPNAAIGIELAAIAACVIGGTSLMGGRGSVISSFIGVLIIAVLLDAIQSRWGKQR